MTSFDRTRAIQLDLRQVLEGIDHGEIVLPDFQRDFDWADSDVRSLVATVLSGWPLGSLLLMEGPPTFFHIRPIEDAPSAGASAIHYIVLDGQQRLTALYQALYGRGIFVYALRLNLLPTRESPRGIDALDDAVVNYRREHWLRNWPTPQAQLAGGLLPMTALRGATEFFKWRDMAVSGTENGLEERERITELYRNFLGGMHDYDIPAVVISRTVQPAAIARIFERVNKTGMPLGAFDLVVAKSYSPGFNLRDAWDSSRRDFPRLEKFFGKDGLPILNVIALRQSENLRQQAVLDLPGAAVRDGWDRAVSAVDDAIRFAEDRLGVWHAEWLPYRNMLTILAALSYDRELSDYNNQIQRWFWLASATGRYDVASNTRAVSDYLALSQNILPSGLRSYLVREQWMDATRKQQGAIHRTVLCAIAANGPYDLDDFDPHPMTSDTETVASSIFIGAPSGRENGYHLRSLGFIIEAVKKAKGTPVPWQAVPPERLSSQLLPQYEDFHDPNMLFSYRLGAIVSFLESRISHKIEVVSELEFDSNGEAFE